METKVITKMMAQMFFSMPTRMHMGQGLLCEETANWIMSTAKTSKLTCWASIAIPTRKSKITAITGVAVTDVIETGIKKT